MSMKPAGAGAGSRGVNYVRQVDQPQSKEQRSDAIRGLATKLADSIKTLSKTVTVTEISAALTQGNVALKEHLNRPPELQGNARDQAKILWRTKLMESLECRDIVAGNSDITKAIPEMAIHIYAQKIGVNDLEYIRWGERLKLPTLADLGKKQCVERIRELVERRVPNHEDLFKAGLHIVLSELLTDPRVVWSDIKDNVSYTFLMLSVSSSLESVNDKPLFDAGAHKGLIAFLSDPRATTHGREYAAQALDNLAMNPANRIRLSDAGLGTSLRSLLEDPKATKRAKILAKSALASLELAP